MKKILAMLPQFATNLCVSFTVAILVYTAFDTAFDFSKETMRRAAVYEMLLICVAATVLQYVFFSGKVVKRLSYLWRMVLFAAVLLPIVAACAMAFQWLPAGRAEYWLVFLGAFLGGYLVIALIFEAGFRLRRRIYDDALGRYKKDREA